MGTDLNLMTDTTYKIETFLRNGRGLDMLTSVDKTLPPIFIAKGALGTPMGQIPIHTRIEGVQTLDSAFENYDAAMGVVVEHLKAQMERQSTEKKIITPDDLRRLGGGGVGNNGRF